VKQLRDAIYAGPAFADQPAGRSAARKAPRHQPIRLPHAIRRNEFALRILLPALLAIALFVAAIWGFIIPSFERALLERKREMIHELTNSAWSILDSYARDERAGQLTRQEAQDLAKARVAALRYGPDGKDYFWLQDMHPRILMHPYRPDLVGQDVSEFTDPRGVRIFVEFADLARRKQAGYIEYVWQWLDDPDRLVPKESYVKAFEPWGWVIGTGLHIDDVKNEIARIEQSLIAVSLAISAGVALLVLFVVQQSLRIERERRDAEASLRESTERYRSLVEATTEGALLALDGRCRYANPTLLQMLGYTARQLELMDLSDVLPQEEANAAAWARIEQPAGETGGSEGFEGVLQRADGRRIECVMALNPISFGGAAGFILLAKDVAPRAGHHGALTAGASGDMAAVAQTTPIGLFRARAARRGVFVELNAAAQALLQEAGPTEDAQPALADLFDDAAAYEEFTARLNEAGAVEDFIAHLKTVNARTRILSISATLARDEHGRPAHIDGAIHDITEARKREAEREALIERLQTSLLFLHEPVGRLGRDVVACDLETPIHQLAALMTASNSTAALIETGSGAAVGIVTDRDLRQRVVAEKLDARTPARAIMSAPLVSVSEHALIYEALMRMEERNVQHLAIADENGRIVGVVHNKDLIQFQRYGATVITREISRAAGPEDVARNCQRAPEVVKALVDSGARPRNITRMISSICDAAAERFIFGEVVRECRRRDIHPLAYFSVIHDNWHYEHHPDWRIERADGVENRLNSRYGVCCPNSPYRDYVAACVREIVSAYDIDGLFFDMTFWPEVCYCPHCVARFRAEAGHEPPRIVDWDNPIWRAWQAARQRWLREFALDTTNAAKSVKPITVNHQFSTIFHNWTLGVPLQMTDACDYVGGDFYGGPAQHALACKVYDGITRSKPFEFHTSRTRLFTDHVTMKPMEEIRAEAFVSTLHHAALMLVDYINIDGALNPQVYAFLGRLSEQRAAYEPFLGGELMADVAIYFDKESLYNPDENGVHVLKLQAPDRCPHRDAVAGLARILQQAHMPFGVVTNANLTLERLCKYRLVALPNALELTPDQAGIFRQYVAGGGNLYASGPSSLDRAGGRLLLEDVLGARYQGKLGSRITYLTPQDSQLGEAIWPQDHLSVAGPMLQVEALPGASVLARITLPFVDPETGTTIGSRFGAIHSNPPALAPSPHPAIVINRHAQGQSVWAAAPVESAHEQVNHKLVAALLSLICPPPYRLEVEAHPAVEATLFYQAERRRYVVSLLNLQQELPQLPVGATVRLTLDAGQRARQVARLPDEAPVLFRAAGEHIAFDVPPFDTFTMLAIDL